MHSFRLGEGEQAVHGRLFRTVRFDGMDHRDVFEMWGAGMRLRWRGGALDVVEYLAVEIPITVSLDGRALRGYLFADGQLVGSVEMLSAVNARRGYGASSAYFNNADYYNPELGIRLAAADRWSFVAAWSDGSELVRRDLAIQDRAGRAAALADYRASLDTAWAERDERVCNLSTPQSRRDEEESSI